MLLHSDGDVVSTDAPDTAADSDEEQLDCDSDDDDEFIVGPNLSFHSELPEKESVHQVEPETPEQAHSEVEETENEHEDDRAMQSPSRVQRRRRRRKKGAAPVFRKMAVS